MYIKKIMLLCLSDANQSTASSELKKAYRKSDIQIANLNEKQDTILSSVNASQNSRQPICKTRNDFHILASIKTDKFDNTLKDQSNYYIQIKIWRYNSLHQK